MNTLWVNLFSPRTLVGLAWCAMSLYSLIQCMSVWRPLYKVSVIAQAESTDVGLLTWIKVPVKIATGLATIAALNLFAGVVWLTFQPSSGQAPFLDDWREFLAFIVPVTFIISAVVKNWLARTLRQSFKVVIATANPLPDEAARLVESL